MCTVTYIPQAGGQYILTTNRDEQASRSPQQLSVESREGATLIFPRDVGAGGTWIVTADSDRTVCLLNGAFEGHEHRPPYRRSRGLMVLDLFDFPSAEEFVAEYQFEGMEPFTMVMVEWGNLYELRWDERTAHFSRMDAGAPRIWSSSTLYPPAIRGKREQWFRRWHPNNGWPELDGILDFHHNAGEGDPWNDVVMNRHGVVQTVSISSVVRSTQSIEMRYEDLLHNNIQWEKIRMKGEMAGSR